MKIDEIFVRFSLDDRKENVTRQNDSIMSLYKRGKMYMWRANVNAKPKIKSQNVNTGLVVGFGEISMPGQMQSREKVIGWGF